MDIVELYKARLANYVDALKRRNEAIAAAQEEVDAARTLLTTVENELILQNRVPGLELNI